MKDCLFLPASCGAQLHEHTLLYWQPSGATGKPLTWADCTSELSGRSFALVIPMERVSACAVKLPTLKPRWLRQALPYAAEECLADDVEGMHLALGSPLNDGRHRLLSVERSLLQGWLGQVAERSLQVSAIYVDADMLPHDGTQVLWHEQRGLLGGDSELRLAFERSAWHSLSAGLVEPLQVLEPPAPWPVLAAGQLQAINLAQGEFSIHQRSANNALWRTVAGMAGLWLILQLGFDLAQSGSLQRQADQQAAASRALYQQLFPEDTRIVNLRAQFDEHLNQAARGQQGQLFGLLQQAARALGEAPQLRVQQLDFSQTRGDLALQLQADDFASLEQFRQRLAEDGLQVQLGSASREAQGVSARVVIGGGA